MYNEQNTILIKSIDESISHMNLSTREECMKSIVIINQFKNKLIAAMEENPSYKEFLSKATNYKNDFFNHKVIYIPDEEDERLANYIFEITNKELEIWNLIIGNKE